MAMMVMMMTKNDEGKNKKERKWEGKEMKHTIITVHWVTNYSRILFTFESSARNAVEYALLILAHKMPHALKKKLCCIYTKFWCRNENEKRMKKMNWSFQSNLAVEGLGDNEMRWDTSLVNIFSHHSSITCLNRTFSKSVNES